MKFITIFDPRTELDFVGKLGLAAKLAVGIVALSVASIVALGIPWGLDFTGGTEMQIKFSKPVSATEVREVLAQAGFEKNQVQQYGTVDDNEMLVRVERLTSLGDENIGRIEAALKESFDVLSPGTELGPDAIQVRFRPEEGDKVVLRIPAPRLDGGAPKNEDEAAVTAALQERLGPPPAEAAPEGEEAPAPAELDNAAIDALAAQGYSRAALAAKARQLGYPVTADDDKTVDKEVAPVVARLQALRGQEQKLIELLDSRSGAKIRRSRRADEAEASTEDSVIREEPYQGLVKYTVHFRGVSIDIERALTEKFGESEIRRVEFVDAQVAKQLQTDGLLAVLYALFFILVYVAVRFDFFFSPGAVIALVHDAVGATILFSLARIEFELPSVAALLTVVGYSINNTIVIYDRIRETVPKDTKQPLSDDEVKGYVNKAINDTFSRTINTSLTTLFASLALFFFAGGVVRNFAAVLSVGIVLGAFSSTFLAPATYLYFRKNFEKPEQQKQKGGLSREDKARGVV